jgi:16S rRNA (guanine(527)-N(7))-methyltransferase RsmG
MNIDVSRENSKLDKYVRLLLKWNKRIALVSRKSTRETLNRLIADTSEAVDLLPADYSTIVDIGSGNGLPGLLFAIHRPQTALVLIERSQKKSLFLEEAVRQLDLENVRIINRAFEEADIPAGGPTAITAIGLDLYGQIQSLLWPLLHAGDALFLFVNKELADDINMHVSCGTCWWHPLPGNNISGVAYCKK